MLMKMCNETNNMVSTLMIASLNIDGASSFHSKDTILNFGDIFEYSRISVVLVLVKAIRCVKNSSHVWIVSVASVCTTEPACSIALSVWRIWSRVLVCAIPVICGQQLLCHHVVSHHETK